MFLKPLIPNAPVLSGSSFSEIEFENKLLKETSSSSLAKWAPKQKWTPPPKLVWLRLARSKSKLSALLNAHESLFADPNSIATLECFFTSTPPTSSSSSTHLWKN